LNVDFNNAFEEVGEKLLGVAHKEVDLLCVEALGES